MVGKAMNQFGMTDYEMARAPKWVVTQLSRLPYLTPAGLRLFGLTVMRDEQNMETILRGNDTALNAITADCFTLKPYRYGS